ncbi:MAG: hypothetical protein HYY17_07370 [Planctomycetes bacterium]|nr:hypothetical protein [Planctomycetota bacterium]
MAEHLRMKILLLAVALAGLGSCAQRPPRFSPPREPLWTVFPNPITCQYPARGAAEHLQSSSSGNAAPLRHH